MNTPRRIPPSLSRDPNGPAPAPEHPAAPVVPEAPLPDASPPRRRSRWPWLLLPIALLLIPAGTVLALRWLPPPTTAFMLQSDVKPVQYQWVPAARIPEALRRAVIAAEDQKFRTHWGFDLVAIAEALEHNEKNRRVRGASTITQQTAKNLFLWSSRSYLRKGLEAGFTLLLELLWPKDRILEVYLNVAEFGPGIYGAEAAARKFFGKPAERLTPAEAAQLAAVLPSPRKYRADRPGPYVQRRTDWILAEIGEAPRYASVPEFEPLPPMDASGQPEPDPVDADASQPQEAQAPVPETPEEPTPQDDPAASDAAPVESTPPDAASADGEPADPSAAEDTATVPQTPQAP